MMTTAPSHLLLRAFCDELVRCGLRHACTSPGSRSSPLVLALTRESRIRCWSHVDERSAGFFAVGAAKAGGVPVALTCTSGTAAANFTPAVIEAWQARVPLIVLTADRPPELREVGAGQAIDQLKLYGSAVKWFFEVGVEDASPPAIRWMRQLACRTYWTALSGRPGPVHLNFPLREPLVPPQTPHPPVPDPAPGRPGGGPWLSADPVTPSPPLPARTLPARGVVVAGREERGRGEQHPAVELAERLGYPLLADPLSGARGSRTAIATYDLLLRNPDFSGRMRPEIVLRFGDLPTSKPLRQWLAVLDGVEQVAFDPEQAWQDPDAVLSEIVTGDPFAWEPSSFPEHGWLPGWREADQKVTEVIDAELDEELSEPLVARRLGSWLGDAATLFVASSMPIRDIELYAPAGRPAATRARILSNRGANGIDGTVSSAFGAAAAGHGPVVLLIGDVALAHDIGGLLAARRLQIPLTIVLLNNDGGGIFHFLPVASQADVFQEHIATPHGLDFSYAADLYGCSFQRVDTVDALEVSVRSSLEAEGTQIIEIRTDREQNLALHQRVTAAAMRALGSGG
jgi:2-succinyl-5-enolpyruvyl-6-hydroxy-3-cyclohexene-1-carboxylate synthase